MPLVNSSYRPPLGLRNGYLQSILPTLFRKVAVPELQRERLELADGDFLDLDWSAGSAPGQRPLVILSHGLEGHSRRPYVLGMAREARRRGFDTLAWNFRGCSGESNRKPFMYHSGATGDLHAVVQHAVRRGYQAVHLVGFSMGGNLSLLYAGRERDQLPAAVRSVVAFSVPCDLSSSAAQLARPANRIFMWRFLRDLRQKLEQKTGPYPDISLDGYEQIRTFQEFDDRYTAPLHGFRDASDYWQQSSCLFYLEQIRLPALLVSARNDPFLSPECFPVELAQGHPWLWLEMPDSGGHVGFISRSRGSWWSEQRALDFIEQQASMPAEQHQPLTTIAS